MTIINITASLVKELRARTGAGFMECKRALIEENGNIELSIDNLRKSGTSKAEKKTYNITNHGAIFSAITDNYGVLLELNCETDFVAKDDLFISFGKKILSEVLENNITELSELKKIFKERKSQLINRIDENVNINNFFYLCGKNIISYVHDHRIGVLVSIDNLNETTKKGIAMHIAASKPEYLYPQDVSDAIIKREYQIQLELSKKLKKSDFVLNKIVEGRMQKFLNSISLIGQNFVLDPNVTVGQLLKKNNAIIRSFVRLEIGHPIISSYYQT